MQNKVKIGFEKKKKQNEGNNIIHSSCTTLSFTNKTSYLT